MKKLYLSPDVEVYSIIKQDVIMVSGDGYITDEFGRSDGIGGGTTL